MTAPRILLTRPEPGASKTTDALIAKGFDVVKMPFTEMVPRKVNWAEEEVAQYKAVVVTSANALRYADGLLIRALASLPVYTVGDATAETARALGFNDIISADGNAVDLCELVKRSLDNSMPVAYLCGITRTDDVEQSMSQAGFLVSAIETYATNKVSQLTYIFETKLSNEPLDALVFYSSVSAQIFAGSVYPAVSHYDFDSTAIFCISHRAAKHVPAAFGDRIHICPLPRDDEMVRLLCQQYLR